MTKVYKTMVAGRELSLEFGKLAGLANGAVLVRYGDTVVVSTATSSDKPREGLDYFPLSVDYEERLYAVGKIPGSFMRREGRPSEKAVLTSRVIDRPMRPLFPSDLRNDVSIVSTVLSVEQDNSPEFCAMIGSSAAVAVSDIPFNGPIAAVYVGYVDGELVVNPNEEQRKKSTMTLTVSASKTKVVMIEAGAQEVPEDVVYDGIMLAQQEIGKLCDFIQGIVDEIGKPKYSYTSMTVDADMFAAIKAFAEGLVKEALDTDDKNTRDERLVVVYDKVYENFAEQYPKDEFDKAIAECLYKLQKTVVREWLTQGKRVDGRGMNEIRSLTAEVGLLPRTHGSGLFARGQTQCLTVATLAPLRENQKLDGLDDEEFKRYMHHYNFPSYSVGETRPSRGPSRRDIGHGALAEKSLEPVLPSEEDFPYAIRLVSEIMSSNGSTSQGAVCGSTLALMDAGVPISAPVAGISCGLIDEGDKGFTTMVDIQGLEDFFGDMDFKVAGTKKGVTSIQMDLKTDGLTPAIIRQALDQTRDARYYILDEIMAPCIAAPREEISQYAPKIIQLTIPADKIADVIGKQGCVIKKIIADTGAKIDVDEDPALGLGFVSIAAVSPESGEAARAMIEAIVKEPEVGEVYMGKVVRIIEVAAFIELMPGKDGFLHISKVAKGRVEKIEDELKIGDEIKVEVTKVEEKMGKVRIDLKRVFED